MANLLFNSGGQVNQAIPGQNQGQYLNNMLQLFKNSKNPQSLLEHMASQNPAMQEVMQMCKGKDPQTVFFELCKQKGVNPNEILSQIQ